MGTRGCKTCLEVFGAAEAGTAPAVDCEAVIDTCACGALGMEAIPPAIGAVEINGLGTSHAGPWFDDDSRLTVAATGWDVVNIAAVPCLDELVGGTPPVTFTFTFTGAVEGCGTRFTV